MSRRLPPDQRHKNNQTVTQVSSTTLWNYSVPPPNILEHYNRIIPNLAERLVSSVELQQNHRMSLESQTLTEEMRLKKRGQIFAFILLLLLLLGGFGAIAFGKELGGGIALFTAIATSAGLVVYSKKSEKQLTQKP